MSSSSTSRALWATSDGDGRFLEGELVLEHGLFSHLHDVFQYRFEAEEAFVPAEWADVKQEDDLELTRYHFRVPLDAERESGTLQLRVEHLGASLLFFFLSSFFFFNDESDPAVWAPRRFSRSVPSENRSLVRWDS